MPDNEASHAATKVGSGPASSEQRQQQQLQGVWKDLQWLNEPGSWLREGRVEEGKEEGRGGWWRVEGAGGGPCDLVVAPDSKKVRTTTTTRTAAWLAVA